MTNISSEATPTPDSPPGSPSDLQVYPSDTQNILLAKNDQHRFLHHLQANVSLSFESKVLSMIINTHNGSHSSSGVESGLELIRRGSIFLRLLPQGAVDEQFAQHVLCPHVLG